MTRPIDEKVINKFKRVRMTIQRAEPFRELVGIMALGKRHVTYDLPTACTNGRDEWYGVDWINRVNDKELGFTMCHENMHKAGRHLEVYEFLHKQDAQLANIAMDRWINYKLRKADPDEKYIAMPRDDNGNFIGMYDADDGGKTVVQIFQLLKQEQKQQQQQGNSGEQGEDSPQSGDGDPQSGDGSSGNPTNSNAGLDDHDWAGAKSMSEEDKKALKADVESAIRSGAMATKIGNGAGGSKLGLDELLVPKVNWLKQLRNFMQSSLRRGQYSSFRRLDRRFLSQDAYMPTMHSEEIKKLVLAPDASYSMMHDGRFTRCMSEIQGLAQQLRVDEIHILYWDCNVTHEKYTAEQFKNWKMHTNPTGGGGTDVGCVSRYIAEHRIDADAVIVLTDGEVSSWGNWKAPVLFAISNKLRTIHAPIGKTIQLEG